MDFTQARERMVREQLAMRGIVSQPVLWAMGAVPRERFVAPELAQYAYDDSPLPIAESQTISQPYMVALMTEALALNGTERVLEIGAGCGYQTAVLSHLAQRVYAIERHSQLAALSRGVLQELGISNVEVIEGDGSVGLPGSAPFDCILVAAAAPAMPIPFTEQVAAEGRIVIPMGSASDQELELWQHRGEAWHINRLAPVRFVPLLGEYGWQNEQAFGR